MDNIIYELNLLPGDRIVVPKSDLRVVQHHALYLGKNHQGVSLIAENKIGFGVRLVSLEEFFSTAIEITRIERFQGTSHDRKMAILMVLNKLGKPYNLINYNCQHFANEIQHGKIRSEQVDNFVAGLKAAAGVFIFFSIINTIFND
ncbi:MAG: hypothetical protein JNM95_11170 [Chitinophagaceae bacterium]|nr:hypothetical protein [Chitinophagaceae bacterium]